MSRRKSWKTKKYESEEDDDDSLTEGEFEVEAILDKRIVSEKLEYYIKYKNYPHSENTWEPIDNVDCPELISVYERKNCHREVEVFYKYEKILDKRIICDEVEYLVHWEGTTDDHNSWVKESQMVYRLPIDLYEESLRQNQKTVYIVTTKAKPLKPIVFKQAQPISKGEITPNSEINTVLDIIRKGKFGEIVCLVNYYGINRIAWIPLNILKKTEPTKVLEYFESRIVWPKLRLDGGIS